MKTTEEFRKFVNENPVGAIATVENGAPRVRHFMRVKWDENGLLFNTGRNKSVFRQLEANPSVEVSFWNPKSNAMVRIRGTAEFTTDKAVLDQVLEVFTFLKPAVEKAGYGILASFYIRDARAAHWTFETSMQTPVWIDLGI